MNIYYILPRNSDYPEEYVRKEFEFEAINKYCSDNGLIQTSDGMFGFFAKAVDVTTPSYFSFSTIDI